MKKHNRILYLILACIVALSVMMPTAAFAAGKIDMGKASSLTICYKDGDKPISGAFFETYLVAEFDQYHYLHLTDDFDGYGLNLDEIEGDEWKVLAYTLKSYVQRDGIEPTASGETDENGILVFEGLKPGLYLTVGYMATLDDFYTYSCTPFLVLVPAETEENDWNYDVTVYPKSDKEITPEDKYTTCKVIKVWDDEGYENLRPVEITVHLYCDGEIYDTQVLNEENNWRYAWDKLDSNHEWYVAEDAVEGYEMSLEIEGITFVINNKFVEPVTNVLPMVFKEITGSTPPKKSTFTFILTPADPSFPMPEGTVDGIKQIEIKGDGVGDFGEIVFEKPGTYVYTIIEKKGDESNYTYDLTVYTVQYTVENVDGELVVERKIVDENGTEKESVVFKNEYTPGLPQTGLLWWPVPILLCVGIVLVCIGIQRRRA